MSRRSSQVAVLAVFLVAVMLSAYGEALPSSVTGVVRDAGGTPQMGALVELLRGDATVVAQAYTDLNGGFDFKHIVPGMYQLKATGESFLPTLRENLRLRADHRAVVDLTLNTLFEATRWLPAERRTPGEPVDDWKWTLRSSSNRPLLRLLEDGPLVVVRDGDSQASPRLAARVAFTSGIRAFGQSGPHDAFEVERSSAGGSHLILRANLDPQPSSDSDYLAGFEQQLGPQQLGLEREMRTMIAMEQTPVVGGPGGQQDVQTLIVRTAESMDLGSNATADFGSQIQAVRGPNQIALNSPFADLTLHSGGSSISYTLATSPVMQDAEGMADSGTLAPVFSEVGGNLRIEHGLHQEVSLENANPEIQVLVAFYRDQIENPLVDGGGSPTSSQLAEGNLLEDPVSQTIRVTGPGYSASGVRVDMQRKLGQSMLASFSYADGSALVSTASDSPVTVSQALLALNAHREQVVSSMLSGTLARTATEWRASYRWQPAGTVTPVDLYDNFAQSAFLSILIRQPIRCGHLPNGVEALVDIRNLLAEGYRPFLTSDGSTLYFAQADRAIQGGLSFSF